MIFKPRQTLDGAEVDDKIFIVVSNLKWALLVWPMTLFDDGSLKLTRRGSLEWYFTTRIDQHESAIPSPILTETGISVSADTWEHSAKTMLRNHSLEMTFADLVFVAGSLLGINDPHKLSRRDLVEALALLLGDADFAKQVLSNEETKKKKKLDDPTADDSCSEDSLAELLLDNMDAADADDFKELKKRVNNKRNLNKKRKWAQWKQEDMEATEKKKALKAMRAKAKSKFNVHGRAKGRGGRGRGRGRGKGRSSRMPAADAQHDEPEEPTAGEPMRQPEDAELEPTGETMRQLKAQSMEATADRTTLDEFVDAVFVKPEAEVGSGASSSRAGVGPDVADGVGSEEAPHGPAVSSDVSVVSNAPHSQSSHQAPAEDSVRMSQGDAASEVLPDSVVPPRVLHEPHGPNLYHSPETLKDLAPPGCSIFLNSNLHCMLLQRLVEG